MTPQDTADLHAEAVADSRRRHPEAWTDEALARERTLEMAGYAEYRDAEAVAAARNAYVDDAMRRAQADNAARFAAAGNYRAAEHAAAESGDYVAAAVYAAAAEYRARHEAGADS